MKESKFHPKLNISTFFLHFAEAISIAKLFCMSLVDEESITWVLERNMRNKKQTGDNPICGILRQRD